MTKNYGKGIQTGFGCKVDEDLHGGTGGTIRVAYYECESLQETVETAVKLLETNYEVTIFSGGLWNPRSYHSQRELLQDFGFYS